MKLTVVYHSGTRHDITSGKHRLNLPVMTNGSVTYSITRHDLLRAWIALGVDIETNSGS